MSLSPVFVNTINNSKFDLLYDEVEADEKFCSAFASLAAKSELTIPACSCPTFIATPCVGLTFLFLWHIL